MDLPTLFGLITGVLSLLVTVLLGYQFYNALTFEKKKREIDEKLKEFDMNVNNMKVYIDNRIMEHLKLFNNSLDAYFLVISTKEKLLKLTPSETLRRLMEALELGLKGSTSLGYRSAMGTLIALQKQCEALFKKKGTSPLSITHKEKAKYISIVKSYPEEDVDANEGDRLF